MYVKPKPGALVRDPVTNQPLPATGAEVPDTQHWHRRLADGDVLPATPPATDDPSAPGEEL